ncbi:hypothetical protein CCAX7_45400 [Capsulimonas corticalis]|uniref:Glycosyl hydrolase family 59 catalytic domain-containing protein n=1 Tax=Capsulimonas corticalis TaxID=2219043 RepID=A0A402D606_9BACT|nr:hypothetical protein [Capsulimonas corticalis]BDI32489.1 hypothetical protein CCAX7_45400 [Capsulimonas corticalis]
MLHHHLQHIARPRPFAIAAAILLSSGTGHAQAPPDEHVAITVAAGARQTFGGFGTSQNGDFGGEYTSLTPAQKTLLARLVWRDAKFNTLRMWFDPTEYAPAPGKRDISKFTRNFIDSGIVREAKAAGCKTLLLVPTEAPAYMGDSKTGLLKEEEYGNYGALLADFILQMKVERGVVIQATGLLNELNDRKFRIPPEKVPAAVKALRRALDARGLTNVKIVAPENANVDGVLYQAFDALTADPEAWRGLYAFASHSYNNSTTNEIAEKIAGAGGKEYWMTEASANGSEEIGDTQAAASAASRVLNDLNHRVTRWIWFLGYEPADPNDDQTRLIRYHARPFQYDLLEPYYYLKQLAATFDVGSVCRRATSSLDGDMAYTSGKKPRITAAAAKNPDGSWSIGISNDTSPNFKDEDDEKDFRLHNSGYAARTFQVTVSVAELAGMGNKTFSLHRSSKTNNLPSETVIMHDGQVTVSVAPLQLVTLRSSRGKH